MKSTPPLIRFAHPMAFQSYLRRLGAPVDRYLRHNGLPALCAPQQILMTFPADGADPVAITDSGR